MTGGSLATSPIGAYLICATPRTGSSLLCGLLESSGVGGHPESYFRRPDERSWAAQWGLLHSPGGSFSYADFVRAAIAAGRTENGVFAARIMWGTLEEMVDKLGDEDPDLIGADLNLLNRAFGPTRFVCLRRDDVVAQAVSWLRAEQTNVWHEADLSRQAQPAAEPQFDLGKIHELVQLVNEHNAAWREWFASVGVTPHPVRYEDLVADPVGVTRGILDYLGLELPPGHDIRARHRSLTDDVNTQWIDRYQDAVREGLVG
jgi:trehalose 2-sulfotransferase